MKQDRDGIRAGGRNRQIRLGVSVQIGDFQRSRRTAGRIVGSGRESPQIAGVLQKDGHRVRSTIRNRDVGQPVGIHVRDGHRAWIGTGGQTGSGDKSPRIAGVLQQDRDAMAEVVGDSQIRQRIPVQVAGSDRNGTVTGGIICRSQELTRTGGVLQHDGDIVVVHVGKYQVGVSIRIQICHQYCTASQAAPSGHRAEERTGIAGILAKNRTAAQGT